MIPDGHSSSVRAPALDRRSKWLLLLLVVGALVLNADRFVLGSAGPQRAHDLADFNITNFMACGRYWTESGGYGWDASSLRGWPVAVGTYATQTLGCLAGAALPPPLIMPVLQVLLIGLMATGTFLFFRVSLSFSVEGALGGTFLQLASFYWFHEHDLVTSATLLPALMGFLELGGGRAAATMRIVALVLIIGMLDPPATLILMPLAHLVLCLGMPTGRRRRLLTHWAIFWAAYGLYYAPTLLDYLKEFGGSSRALFHAPPRSTGWIELTRRLLYSVNVISPVLAALALASRRTWRPVAIGLSVMVLVVVTVAANRYWIVEGAASTHSILLAASTTYYRLFYMIPVVAVVMGGYLVERALADARWTVVLVRIVALGACYAVAVVVAGHESGSYGYLPKYVLLVGGSLVVFSALGRRRFVLACALLVIAAWPLRAWYTRLYESPRQGNLFIERARTSPGMSPFRVATLMRTCDASDVFPAQAAVLGEETLGGISNFYSREFVEWWQRAVSDPTGGCTARYRYWNSRADLTVETWKKEPETLFGWMWFNNVALVRSVEPLEHAGLELVDQRTFNIQWFGAVHRYQYRLRDPLGRVFVVPEPVLERFAGTSASDQVALLNDAGVRRSFRTVPIDRYQPSVISFRGAFKPGDSVVVSINFHSGWALDVDGVRQDNSVQRGPLGTLRIVPKAGEHSYTLRFEGRRRPVILAGMLGGGLFLVFMVGSSPRMRNDDSA